MKKLESLTNSKFNSFEGSKIESLSKIFGGYITSEANGGRDCDTYSWTPRDIKDAQGSVIGTTNERDNVRWFKCNSVDTVARNE